MKSVSVYLLVVISGILFISSTPTLSLSEVKSKVKRPIKTSISEKKLIEEKVKSDLKAVKSPIITIALKSNTSEVSNNVETMSKKNKTVVEEYRQATLSEAAQTFNRKCLELEALLKER
jgi:hypothetical protein